jgi:UV DNA damage endonuclease
MLEAARANLLALEDILKWNLRHNTSLFRITSSLIPFGSSTINSGFWKTALQAEFQRIGDFIKSNNMRVSMHPGQYTVINTPEEAIFNNTLKDIEYHNTIFKLMGLDSSHKIILHGGGAYGNKNHYASLLIERINKFETSIRDRIALENDERVFNASDILNICRICGIPAVLDIFHHQVLPSLNDIPLPDIIQLFQKTWDGERQKIHYSNQEPTKPRGSHSQTINLSEFSQFYNSIKNADLDIMLEVKDKQASVLKLRQVFPELQ